MPIKFNFIIPEEIINNDKYIYFCDFLIYTDRLSTELNGQVFTAFSQDDFSKRIKVNNPLKLKGFKESETKEQVITLKITNFKIIGTISTFAYNQHKTNSS